MTTYRRSVLLTLLCVVAAAALAPAARAAGNIGLSEWEAGTCNGTETTVKNCKYSSPPSDFFTQSAGHPPWGLTGFKVSESSAGVPAGQPIKRIRVDVPPGLAANPQVLDTCPRATFESSPKTCPATSKAGFVELKAFVELPVLPQTLTLTGSVYNLPQESGRPLLFGIDVEGVPPLVEDTLLMLVGHVSWGGEPSLAARGIPSGDFHEWFEIDNVPTTVAAKIGPIEVAQVPLKTLESKLFFNGRAGTGGRENFLTMPSSCAAPTTSYLELETYPPTERLSAPTTPPVGVDGCDKVPFQPLAEVTPVPSQYDSPDGAVTTVHVPQNEKANQVNTADISDAHVTLPEGLTLNPAAANGLQACTQAQLGKGTTNPVTCPGASKIGTVNIETALPPHTLFGNVYLGKKNGTGAIGGPPYLLFIDAETVYGVSVRLEGQAIPDPATGRLEVELPRQPAAALQRTDAGGQRRPALAAREPDGLRESNHQLRVHPLHRRRAVHARDAVRRRPAVRRRSPSR